MAEPQAASINAMFKCWHVNSGGFERHDTCKHWAYFIEPLDVPRNPDLRPSCYLNNRVGFYDPSGNKQVAEVQTYGFPGAHPNLLYVDGGFWEVFSGQVVWDTETEYWTMRWSIADNTRWANVANSGWRAEQTRQEIDRAFNDDDR